MPWRAQGSSDATYVSREAQQQSVSTRLPSTERDQGHRYLPRRDRENGRRTPPQTVSQPLGQPPPSSLLPPIFLGMAKPVILDGESLSIEQIVAVSRQAADVSIAPEAAARARDSRSVIEEAVANGAVIYGVNTGFGKLANVKIHDEQLEELQRNLIRSHGRLETCRSQRVPGRKQVADRTLCGLTDLYLTFSHHRQRHMCQRS